LSSEAPVTSPGPKDLKNNLKEAVKDLLALGKIRSPHSSSSSTFLPSPLLSANAYHIIEVIYRICVFSIITIKEFKFKSFRNAG
jgi:hypothetical protein